VLVQEDFRADIHTLDTYKDFWALAIFLAAATTDLLDGYLARRWVRPQRWARCWTHCGQVADISGTDFTGSDPSPSGMDGGGDSRREFAVSGLRSIAAVEGYTIRASELGKTKMVLQWWPFLW